MFSIHKTLSKSAQQTPSADNSQPWKLDWQDNTLMVRYDSLRVKTHTFPPNSHAILLTVGALSENLSLASAALNIKLDFGWSSSIDLTNPTYFQAEISKIEFAKPITLEELPLFKRHTNRHPFLGKLLPFDTLDVLRNLTHDHARSLIIEDKTEIQQITRLVRNASEVRFQIQEVHEWLAKSFRFNTKPEDPYGEGLDVNTIDLPPGGRWFLRLISSWQRMHWLNKLGMYKAMAMIDSQPIGQAPALVAIVGPDSYKDNIAAGQLMNRAWIELNAQDVAVHPYYVITDQLQRLKDNKTPEHLIRQVSTLENDTRQILRLQEGEILHMLFRIGYPSKTPVKSKRLPLQRVCSGLDIKEN